MECNRRRAGGLARTFVVAVATLAILLVCFSMYQYSQSPPPAQLTPRTTRLPIPGEDPPPPRAAGEQPAGVMVDGTVIGASKDVWISLYTKEGRDSKLEMTVSDWSPKAGSDHEFLLRDPEIRMRTAEGNDLRVKADEGSLDAQRKSGSGLQPRRGRLTGNVVIEFDRRSEEDKARLSESERNKAADYDLVRVHASELLFDVEFGRLVMPGRVVLTARDAGLEAHDLELQLDPEENRVQSLRIDRGGRIELHSQSEGLGLSPGDQRTQPQKQTIADWMRESLRARLEARAAADAKENDADASGQPGEAPADADPGLPVFRPTKKQRTRTVAHYLGRFEGDVDARQQIGDTTQARLQADWLEILREMSMENKADQKKKTPALAGAAATTAENMPVLPETITLSWSGKLVVSQVEPNADGERPTSSRLTAGGKPARLSHPDGEAVCSRMSFLPQTGDVELSGEGSEWVLVRSTQQGTIKGQSVTLRREADKLDIVIDGRGWIWEDAESTPATPLSVEAIEKLGPANIEFAEELRATGRLLQKTTLDFTGALTTREHRLLDHVTFAGRTTLRQDGTSLQADQIDVAFQINESWRGVSQNMEMLTGTGHVLMEQQGDRLICDKIDISMSGGVDGKSVVKSATATGSVVALQDDRTLQASEKLIVDFKPEDSGGVVKVSETLITPGHTTGDGLSSPRSMSFSSAATPHRLRAFGQVSVIDPSQSLELSCAELDCTIADGNDIETALLTGLDDRPSFVSLESFSVTGKDIHLDVANEWADVPGAGRMIILSQKDLDGRKVNRPIPIAVNWTDGMKYRGRENRAIFSGRIHASSEATTTFDCEESLLVEFEDSPQPAPKRRQGLWESLGVRVAIDNLDNLVSGKQPPRLGSLRTFAKEPRYIEASGNAVAQTAEHFPETTLLKSRARISGPKLSLHLRSELSKMLIEGPGDLLLEDFQPERQTSAPVDVMRADLFSDQSDAGPSKTLINWRQRMSYDFGIDQTLFEGDVQLKHFSGAELDKVFGVPDGGTSSTSRGRRTFLTSDALTVDFTDSASRTTPNDGEQRMGRISSDRLHRFRANGRVVLREEVEQFTLNAEEITYERPRKILLIHGSPFRKAQLIRQRPGKLPDQMAAERIFYSLETGKIEISRPNLRTGQ